MSKKDKQKKSRQIHGIKTMPTTRNEICSLRYFTSFTCFYSTPGQRLYRTHSGEGLCTLDNATSNSVSIYEEGKLTWFTVVLFWLPTVEGPG